ncbi:MAG: DUF1992 domain-containing protein [Rhodobacteraceae bacterium]|nr:DUF1992 domain-containing protein [Paracoccaceae bacterium]
MKFNQLVESQIRKAQMKGELENLKGEGEPLPDRPLGSDAEQIGYRIMAEAGALPEEILLQRRVKAAAKHLKSLSDPAERKAAMAELSQLQMKLSVQEEARKKFMK